MLPFMMTAVCSLRHDEGCGLQLAKRRNNGYRHVDTKDAGNKKAARRRLLVQQ